MPAQTFRGKAKKSPWIPLDELFHVPSSALKGTPATAFAKRPFSETARLMEFRTDTLFRPRHAIGVLMPSLPAVSDLSTLVATLDRHPFGSLAFIVLGVIVLGVVFALRRQKR